MAIHSESDHAFFERTAADLLEIRLKPGVRIDGACIAEVIRERKRLAGPDALCVLLVIPADAELDIAVIGTDHHLVNEGAGGLRAMAIVCGTLMMETMARLYTAYYPPAYGSALFGNETDARNWLDERLAEFRRTDTHVQPKSSLT